MRDKSMGAPMAVRSATLEGSEHNDMPGMVEVRILFLEDGLNDAGWFGIDTIKIAGVPREGDLIVFSKPSERCVIVTRMFWSNFSEFAPDSKAFFPCIFVRDHDTTHDMPAAAQ